MAARKLERNKEADMTMKHPISALVLLGGLLAASAAGTGGHGSAGSPTALAQSIPLGPFAYDVAVDERASHAFVLSAGTDSEDIGESPTGQGYLSMLDARTGRLLRALAVGAGPYALAVDDRTGHLFVVSRGAISMVDTGDGRVLRTVPLPGGDHASLTAAGSLALVIAPRLDRLFVEIGQAPGVATLLLLGTRTGSVLRTMPRRTGFGGDCSCAPGDVLVIDEAMGRLFLAPLPTGHTVSVLDARTLTTLRTVALAGAVVGLAVDEVAARVLVETSTAHSYGVSILDAHDGAIRRTITLGALTLLGKSFVLPSILVSRLSSTLRAGLIVDLRTSHAFVFRGGIQREGSTPAGTGRVTMLDTRSGTVLRTTRIAADAVAAVMDAGAGQLLVASTTVDDGHGHYHPIGALSMLDTRSGTLVRAVRIAPLSGSYFLDTPLAVDARTGRAFLVNRRRNSVSVLDTGSGLLVRTVPLQPAPVPRS